MIFDNLSSGFDLGHFAYTTLAYALPSIFPLVPRSWTGWAGDCASLGGSISKLRGDVPLGIDGQTEYAAFLKAQTERAVERFATESVDSPFNVYDYNSDIDTYLLDGID